MDEILNERIKAVIERYPEVGNVLGEFDIACVSCAVGTCLLKDILEIHRMSAEDEQRLMSRIAEIIYPDRKIELPRRKEEPVPQKNTLSYSPPLQRLVDEHTWIKRLLALIPAIVRELDLETDEGRQFILSALDFIRSYADKYHHAKEEDILFKDFDANLDILQAMLTDHETGRRHVRTIMEAVERRDIATAGEHLLAYQDLLTEHIKKEDEVLYPWLDRQLSDTQVGRLFAAFNEAEGPMADARERCEKFIQLAERRFGGKESKTQQKKGR